MPLWGNLDQANNAPKYQVIAGPKAYGAYVNGEVAFQNTTPGAFIYEQAVGVYGVNATAVATYANSHNGRYPAHSGWVEQRLGTGPIISIVETSANTSGYTNADVVTVVSGEAGGNATASIVTSNTGAILSVNITNPGYGFVNVLNSNNVVINTASNTAVGAVFEATAGGKAGRVQWETLVAMHINS